MKHLILFLSIALLVGCNKSGVPQKALDLYNAKCAEDSKIERRPDGKFSIRLHCTNLHDTVQVKKYLDEGSINYRVTGGDVLILGVSSDSIPDIWAITKAIAKGVKK